MPWRPRPRAALITGLLAATALVAAAAGLRGRDTGTSPLPPSTPASIDDTLTLDPSGCAAVRSTVWHPLSGVEYTGRLSIALPALLGGAIALYVGDRIPLTLDATGDDGNGVELHLQRLESALSVDLPPDFWLDDGSPWDAPQQISRVTIDALGHRDRHVTVSLGRRAPRVLARLIGYPASVRVPVCAAPLGADEMHFATGWYEMERDPNDESVRWMGEHGAVLVSSRHGRDALIRARLAPASINRTSPTVLTLRINDVFETAPIVLAAGTADYEWAVPDAAWVAGTNELFFSVTPTRTSGTRTLGLVLSSLHVQ